MRASLSLVLTLALAAPRVAHAGWSREQRAALDAIVALENAGKLEEAVARAEQEFGRVDAPGGYRRAVAKRGKTAALALFERSKDPRHLCYALGMLRVYAADLVTSEQDRVEIPAEVATLEARAVAVAAPCATVELPGSTSSESAASASPPTSTLTLPERQDSGLHVEDGLLPVVRKRETARRPTAGRGLLIVGGILAGGTSIAVGLAAGAGLHADRLTREQNAIAVEAHEQGFSTPDMSRQSGTFATAVARWDRVAFGAALSCAVLGSTAIAFLTAGAVKRRRASRATLTPGLGILLFSARF